MAAYRLRLAGMALATCLAGPAFADPWYPYDAAQITPPFSLDGKASPVSYVPLWNMLDTTPEGRAATWYPSLSY